MASLISRRRRSALLAGGAGLVLVAVVPAAAAQGAQPAPPAQSAHSGGTLDTSHAGQAAAPPDGYYKDAEGKSGQELKDALHGIISKGAKTLSYDQVWDALKVTDQDPKNSSNVVLLYSGRSDSKDNNGGGKGQWNREHTWAKSHGDFGTAPGPGTDVHHLRPADVSVNSTRGNLDFDNGGGEVEGAPGNRVDDDSFEPRDAVKGDVARMILYMGVRYEKGDKVDLEPNDKVDNGSAPNIGKLSVLKKWSEQDPPDDFEKNRNDVIYDKFQHNRNPFVDHPEWVNKVY